MRSTRLAISAALGQLSLAAIISLLLAASSRDLQGQAAHAPDDRSAPTSAAKPYDIVIINGHIIDGTGSPWYSGDVGIRDGRIAAIGNLSSAPRDRPSMRAAWSSRPASSTCSASPR